MTTLGQNVEITVTGAPPEDPDNEGTPVFDAGWDVPPVTGRHADGPKIVGRNKGTATVIYPLSTLGAGGRYHVKLTPDWSGMSQGGKGIILGFGFVGSGSPSTSDFHIIGQAYDGQEMRVQRVYGSDLESSKHATLTLDDLAASTNGSEDGPNYQDIHGSSDGETYAFRTSPDGVVYEDEVTLIDPDPFVDLAEPNQFGIGIYVPGNNRGTLSVEIEILSVANYINGKVAHNFNTTSALTTALPVGAQVGDLCIVHGGMDTGPMSITGGGAGAWTQINAYEQGGRYDFETYYKILDGTDDIVFQSTDEPLQSFYDRGLVALVFRNASYVSHTVVNQVAATVNVNSPSLSDHDILAVMTCAQPFGSIIELTGGNNVGPSDSSDQHVQVGSRYGTGLTGVQACSSESSNATEGHSLIAIRLS